MNFHFLEEQYQAAVEAGIEKPLPELANGNGKAWRNRQQQGLQVCEVASAPLDINGFSIYSGSELKFYNSPIRTGVTDIESLRLSVLPAGKRERLQLADQYYNSDDFLGSVLDLKCDFTSLGFNLTYGLTRQEEAKLLRMDDEQLEKNDLDEAETQAIIEDYLGNVALEWNFSNIVSDLFLRLFICDSFVLYWRTGKDKRPGTTTLPGVWQILSLNPKDCEWENDQGQDRLLYYLPWNIRKKIQDANQIGFGTTNEEQRQARLQALLDEGMPQEWIDAVLKGDGTVEFHKDQGYNWIIYTKGPEQDGLANPSMYKIFLPLESRRALRDGDFTTSWLMKHFIQHVTIGESATGSGFASASRATWATEPEINAMHEVIRQGVRSSRLVTNHTVKISYIYPPKEMFDGAKYTKPELSILYWSHMLQIMMKGEGGTNSSGYLGMKSVDAHFTFSRERVREAVVKFFKILRAEKKFQDLPDKYVISCAFDRNALKEPRQVTDELKFFVDINAMSPETALRETGRDSQRILLEKRRANIIQRKTGLYKPVVIRSSQLSSGNSGPATLQTSANQDNRQDNGGRPPNASTTLNEDTRTQSPPTGQQ